jgi:uncharacterized membrane protein
MRRWLFPLLVGLLMAIGAYQVALVQFPRVVMRLAIDRLSQPGINTLYAAPLATDKARTIVRPSPDLAYSSCAFDLADGPILVDVPPMPAPYWSLSVFDARTDVAFVQNNVSNGGLPIRIAIARAGQPVPDGRQAIRVDDDRGVALIRVLVPDRAAFTAIDSARRRARCQPLS